MSDTQLSDALAARRARAAKFEAADIERTRERMLAVAKRLGVVTEDTTVEDVLAQPMPMPAVTVIERWSDPNPPADDMTDGEAFIAWGTSNASHADLRRRAANEGGEL